MKESTSYLFGYPTDRRAKCLNLGQKGRLYSQSESSALEVMGGCEKCLKLTYAGFPGASWYQFVST